MKKLFALSAIATVLAASTAFAFEVPATQPIKPTEGPNTPYATLQSIKGIEGPDVRLMDDGQPTQPLKGIEGPDVRLVAFAVEVPSTQPIRGTEGPDIRLTLDDRTTQPIRGTEGPEIR